jgi:hypothetical protein
LNGIELRSDALKQGKQRTLHLEVTHIRNHRLITSIN